MVGSGYLLSLHVAYGLNILNSVPQITMAITKLVYHSGHKKGLREVKDDSFMKGRGKYKGIFRDRKPKWYMKDIEGTTEELEESWKVAEEYLYKILNYAEQDVLLSEEELEEARRIFSFVRQGPRAHTFVVEKDAKLTSADVFYILTTTVPGSHMAKRFGITTVEVNKIRNGNSPAWEWEYHFVKRIKTIVRTYLTKTRDLGRSVWTLSKVHSPTQTEVLVYTTSQRKAKNIRESILTKKEMEDLVKKGTLDVVYPIHKVELV